MAFVWSAAQYGLPLLSKQLAFSLPVSLSNQAASQTLRILDETLLSPSMLSQTQRQAIRQQFQPFITAQATLPLKIQFRHGGEMGPNAFALPDGTIVFTDELVQLASADEELIAVLAHEAGHVAHRHGTRAVIQNSLLLFLAMAIIGDSSGIAEVFMGFPLMILERSYSRDFEREADSYALTYMQVNNIELSHFVAMLERIELSGRCQHYFAGSGQEHSQQLCRTAEGLKEAQQHGWVVNQSTEKNEWPSYLSTHPDNAERRARFSQ
jgi:Zn-dependent protease with chaperone function